MGLYGHPVNITMTANGYMGVETSTPTSTLQVAGSVAVPYGVVNNSGAYALSASDHTIRRFGNVTSIIFPDATTCPGREYTIIASQGTGALTLNTATGQYIYDDVTNTHFESTGLPANSRITVQSDGTGGWIVIGN